LDSPTQPYDRRCRAIAALQASEGIAPGLFRPHTSHGRKPQINLFENGVQMRGGLG
jgi:hypothetical protein